MYDVVMWFRISLTFCYYCCLLTAECHWTRDTGGQCLIKVCGATIPSLPRCLTTVWKTHSRVGNKKKHFIHSGLWCTESSRDTQDDWGTTTCTWEPLLHSQTCSKPTTIAKKAQTQKHLEAAHPHLAAVVSRNSTLKPAKLNSIWKVLAMIGQWVKYVDVTSIMPSYWHSIVHCESVLLILWYCFINARFCGWINQYYWGERSHHNLTCYIMRWGQIKFPSRPLMVAVTGAFFSDWRSICFCCCIYLVVLPRTCLILCILWFSTFLYVVM